MKKRYRSCGIHVGMFTFLFLFSTNMISSSKKIYILLLGMKYEKKTSNNIQRIKTASLKIGGRYLNIEVKNNADIYLKDSENQNNKILFKQILIKNEKNESKDNIYLKVTNKSIEDQLSITFLEYPKIGIFKNYDLIENYIYEIVFLFSYNQYLLSPKSDSNYQNLKKAIINNKIKFKYDNIYIFYENLDILNNSRSWFFVIYYIYIIFSMGKRICFGGYKNSFCVQISFIISLIFMLLFIFIFILTAT